MGVRPANMVIATRRQSVRMENPVNANAPATIPPSPQNKKLLISPQAVKLDGDIL